MLPFSGVLGSRPPPSSHCSYLRRRFPDGAVALITVSSVVLTFDENETFTFSPGSLFVIGAAICWGLETLKEIPKFKGSLMDLFCESAGIGCFMHGNNRLGIDVPNKQARAVLSLFGLRVPGHIDLAAWKSKIRAR